MAAHERQGGKLRGRPSAEALDLFYEVILVVVAVFGHVVKPVGVACAEEFSVDVGEAYPHEEMLGCNACAASEITRQRAWRRGGRGQ